jgi:NTP pyrophosphatase (non-canonical NTP hydrolase)
MDNLTSLEAKENYAIRALEAAMKFKFAVHRHKGDWAHKSLALLVSELHKEVVELTEAVDERLSREHIIAECADIANYCAMLIDNLKDDK